MFTKYSKQLTLGTATIVSHSLRLVRPLFNEVNEVLQMAERCQISRVNYLNINTLQRKYFVTQFNLVVSSD